MADRQPNPRQNDDLPLRFRVAVLGILVATFVIHLAIDVFKDDYDGGSTTLLIGGIIGAAIGVREIVRSRG